MMANIRVSGIIGAGDGSQYPSGPYGEDIYPYLFQLGSDISASVKVAVWKLSDAVPVMSNAAT
jgi:hypothetical protein